MLRRKKMKLMKFISLTLALAMMLSTVAFANNATTTTEPTIDIEEITLNGYEMFVPTSSTSYIGDENAKLPTSFLFDRSSETEINVTVSSIDSYDVYVANNSTKALAAFGIIVDGVEGTRVEIKVYGTNDPVDGKWDHLLIKLGKAQDISGYKVFEILEEDVAQYLHYKFEITAEGCGDITITELGLLKTNDKGPELEWDFTLEVPKLVPVGTVGKHQKKQTNRALRMSLFALSR